MLADAGLPKPDLNVAITDAAGAVIGYGDIVYRPWKVVVEYDGQHHRVSSAQYAKDESRLEAFQLVGWLVVRIRADGLTRQGRSATVRRVRSALTSRGWFSARS